MMKKSINKFATELSKLPIESLTQGEQSNDNLVRDFATGNLVKEFDETETDDKVIQNDQFNNFDNNLEELTDEEDEEDEEEEE
jgi:hypothetical protein